MIFMGESGPTRRRRRLQILVSGSGTGRPEDLVAGEETGRLLARSGAVLLTGGYGGVMEASCRGAKAEGGTVLAVLPGVDESQAPVNPFVDLTIFTGMGHARNALLAVSADAVIAIGGGWGTLSEIALARTFGRPVVLLESWRVSPSAPSDLEEPPRAATPAEAVRMALDAAEGARRP
jgi:uncharacterized protein (TIGR00725 family)